MRDLRLRDGLSLLLTVLGTAIAMVPVLIYWLVESDEYRLWVISGPPPFCYLGSGPLLTWIGVGGLGLGVSLICVAVRLLRRNSGSPGGA